MKYSFANAVRRAICIGLPLLAVAGCPLDGLQTSALDTLDGTYWVEYTKGELIIYELPAERADDALWYALATDEPDWYEGPGLYDSGPHGQWSRTSDDDDRTLDEILQLYDPRPRPEEPEQLTLGERLAGLYWITYTDGTLSLYEFPMYRDETGTWHDLEREQPDWYVGTGLYEVDEYFAWRRVASEEEVALDELQMLLDFRPRPAEVPETGAPSAG